jgi:hypothetical protein
MVLINLEVKSEVELKLLRIPKKCKVSIVL